MHMQDFTTNLVLFLNILINTQVDRNGIVYDPKMDRKCRKNRAFTAVYRRDGRNTSHSHSHI